MPAEIPLNRGRVALVDECDAASVLCHTWTVRIDDSTREYAFRRLPKNERPPSMVYLHHQIIGRPPVGLVVDHHDGNGLNNCRMNIRFVSQRANMTNQAKRSTGGTSQFKGVHFCNWTRKWRASIRTRVTVKQLGGFASELDAAVAYDARARELYGEFGTYNFPLPGERSAITGMIEPLPEAQAA